MTYNRIFADGTWYAVEPPTPLPMMMPDAMNLILYIVVAKDSHWCQSVNVTKFKSIH
jgi:hypothetical protein